MGEEETKPQTEETVAPAKAKKKRGRPKGSGKKKAKKEDATVGQLGQIADLLGTISDRLDKVEEVASAQASSGVYARGPGAPTMNGRSNAELGIQMPGPSPEQDRPDVRDRKRREKIYTERETRGRVDREKGVSGAVSSVGNRQRRQQGSNPVTNQPR